MRLNDRNGDRAAPAERAHHSLFSSRRYASPLHSGDVLIGYLEEQLDDSPAIVLLRSGGLRTIIDMSNVAAVDEMRRSYQ